ncbi:MAG: VOC family protein [Geodermatophilaceae bacterium]|nr:VOC family protein [Geodermatophilaceae bacterium]
MTVEESTSDLPPPPGLVLVLDARDAAGVAEFWAAALRYDRRASVGQFEVLTPPAGSGAPALLVQGVGEAKVGKNRMHVDLHVADPEAEAARLILLGATRLGDGRLDDIRWITMADPEGNEFDLAWD